MTTLTRRLFTLAVTLTLVAPLCLRAQTDPGWTTPLPPFQIADKLYYVGSRDLASYLVVTPKGNILINANLESSPPQIRAAVEKLGFKWADTKILLNAQAHFDHMAGAAQIVRETRATNMVMEGDVDVAESGGAKGFQANWKSLAKYAPVHVDRVLHDGDPVSLGGVTLVAHKTAGHTRGCTTWTMRMHVPGEPAGTLRNIVIVGGVSFWSEYRFVDAPRRPASYPGIAQDYRDTFATLRALPCDVFLGAHGQYFNLLAKLGDYPAEGPRVFIDPAGYQAFVEKAQRDFEQALASQEADAPH
jgi:metallo-beta-lactamase class B